MDPSDTNGRVSLKAAMTTVPLSSQTYLANLPSDHCLGSAVHGGLLASTVLDAVRQHFHTTLQRYEQPHTFSLHLVFLRPAVAGQAILEIRDTKPGKGTSTIHISLSQNGKECVVGYALNMNLQFAKGLSYPTHYTLNPPPPPADIAKLTNNTDPHWVSYTYPYHPDSCIKASTHLRFVVPIKPPPHPSISDVWFTPIHAEDAFTNEMLGSVIDYWPRMPENYHSGSPYGISGLAARGLRTMQGSPSEDISQQTPQYGYPTLSMNLEIKKLLPPEGVKWLFMRARAKEIKNGRMDAEITVLDEALELVALSHQVSFIVNFAQTPAIMPRRKDGKL